MNNKQEFNKQLLQSLVDLVYNSFTNLATTKKVEDLKKNIEKDANKVVNLVSDYIDGIQSTIENNVDNTQVNTEDKKNKIEGKGNTNKTGKITGKK